MHVDILWQEFNARLERRFSRPVVVVYKRKGDSQVES